MVGLDHIDLIVSKDENRTISILRERNELEDEQQ